MALLALAIPAAWAQTVETILGNGLFEPYGVAIGVGNLYYITDSANNRVIVLNPLTGGATNLAGVAGNGGAGAQDGTSEQARFYSPQGIVRTSSALYIADSGNNLIRKIDLNGIVSTIVGDIRYPQLSHANQLPMDNAGANDGPGILAKVNAPSGLALDKGGTNLFIADTLNGSIRRVALTGNYPVSTLMVKDQGLPVAAHFNRPAAVAVSATGRIFVADSERHAIYELIEGDHIELIAGSGNTQASGTTDSSTAIQALFKSPRGLYIDDIRHEILVSDSGNGLLRRITNLDQGAMGVQTVPGSKDAGILKPIGISRDTESVIVFADLDANAIKGLRQTTTQPQIAAPIIGNIVNTNLNFPQDCQFLVITNVTFFNDQFLTIQSEGGTATYFTFGPTENAANIPDPGPEFSAAPDFADCHSTSRVNLMSRISPLSPRLTIKAMSTAENRRPSPITVANVTFQAANPSILGADSMGVSFATQTDGAKIYYTYGDNPPDPNPADSETTHSYTVGTTLNLFDSRTNVTVKVIATKENYVTSSVVARTFLKTDVRRSVIGIPRNFVAGVGSTIVVPMSLDVAPSNVVRTLQYRVEITPKAGAHTNAIPTPSLLPVRPGDFIAINFPGANLASSAAYSLSDANKAVIARGLSVFFLQTNINFVVTNQVTLGVLAVQIPRNAVEGDAYNIAIVKPSGTSDGIDTPVALAASAAATITITNKPYVVGDVGPAQWYNVGDFGTVTSPNEPVIENNDVTLAFRASLGQATPYAFSDVFDAMDAFPLDAEGFAGGDGVIRFLDWQTILRRSLGLDQAMWQRRRDANGDIVVNSLSGGLPLNAAEMLLAAAPENTAAGAATDSQIVWSREALLCAGSLDGDGIIQGNTVSVPINLTVRPGKSISGMQFTVTVTPMGNNPPVSTVSFQIAPGLPGASLSATGVGMITPAWNLGSFVPSLTGSNLVGYVRFQVPLNAITGQSYLVELAGEGEPDEFTQYNFFETSRGYVTVHALGPVDDSISDQWRTNFFGSVDASLSAAAADPDGDGIPNVVEFRDGTSPIVNNFRLQVSHSFPNGKNTVLLQWFGGSGLKYSVEASDTLQANSWLPVAASITGQGGMLQFTNQSALTPQFYRVRIVP